MMGGDASVAGIRSHFEVIGRRGGVTIGGSATSYEVMQWCWGQSLL